MWPTPDLEQQPETCHKIQRPVDQEVLVSDHPRTGWPIASPACSRLPSAKSAKIGRASRRSLGFQGPEAVLHLRALSAHGDWNLYSAVHLTQVRERDRYLDGASPRSSATPALRESRIRTI